MKKNYTNYTFTQQVAMEFIIISETECCNVKNFRKNQFRKNIVLKPLCFNYTFYNTDLVLILSTG